MIGPTLTIRELEDKDDWYVAMPSRIQKGPRTRSGMRYVFGGTFQQVKNYVEKTKGIIKDRLTWVPLEYMLGDVEHFITQST